MRKFLHIGLVAGLAVICSCAGKPVHAENRALLIGVGEYELSSANLPGIDLDINMMRDVAQLMGFKKDQIKTLLDGQATLDNTKRTMQDWLVKGVKKDDRVLIYYSGHGTQIPDTSGDEGKDGQDEVLTMHDLKLVTVNGQATLKGVLVDDVFHDTLGRIKSENILVLVDACHSGTSTKAFKFRSLASGESEGVEKFYSYPGMALSSKGSFGGELAEKSNGNYVAIGAAADNEKSIASKSGSFFTLGLKATIEKANREGKSLTPSDLHQGAAAFVKEKIEPSRVFHPQLTGSAVLARKPLQMSRVESGRGPKWQRVTALVKKMNPLAVQSSKKNFKAGELLELAVDVPGDGYLNVFVIDSQDTPTVLFPNKFNKNNRVAKGKVRVPGSMKFSLKAGSPYGPNLIVALYSTRNINMFEDGSGKRDSKGIMQDFFPGVSEKSMRGFEVTKKSAVNYGGIVELQVKP